MADNDYEIMVLVPEQLDMEVETDPAFEPHMKPTRDKSRKKIVSINSIEVEKQWSETIKHLVTLSSKAEPEDSKWKIDTIEVGLAVSAKGKLVFVAEASAEVSIKITLKRT